ncbi:MAG TPA: LysM peptidoglycan-binding domain-containing protein [Bacteroidales bacterium]|nr:LysM peptidoglycan-binding domain-containing protein [Bacteroidales bacterium]
MVVKNVPSVLLLLLIPFWLGAQEPIRPDSTYRLPKLIEDDQVIVMLDSLSALKFFEDTYFPKAQEVQAWPSYSDYPAPVFPDSVYAERIAQMNDQSPFEYVYNGDVKKFIDLYAVRKRKLTARILGLTQIYFPLFEEQLDRFNMPLELKYLAVIESALNPVANSPAGAKGLWQFMYGTGKGYGLKVSTYVDDRFDPYKSTIAACEHLSDLYDIYGSWSLALAAYNSGAGNVNKAIRRSGGMKNFWAIKKFLPRETASYVPAFIAASYVLNYANEHKIYPVDPGILYYEVDTVTVHNPLSFDQISEMLNVPMDEIVFLNPSFKCKVIPATPETPYKLRLRKKYIGPFINNEAALYTYKTRAGLASEALAKLVSESYRESTLYTVKSGETIASLAKKFHMTPAEVRSLNGLKKNSVKPGKKILVYTGKGKAPVEGVVSTYVPQPLQRDTGSASPPALTQADDNSTTEVKNDPPVKAAPAPKSVHLVQAGESLGMISKKYGCTVADLMKWNDLKEQKLLVGQKIKVKPSGSSSTSSPRTQTSSKSKSADSGRGPAWYTIKAGDNLWDIADKFDVTVSQLKAANNLKTNSRLKPGQRIKIPK